MAKVTYTPVADHGDEGETRQAGYHFEKGKAVEVNDEQVLAKMRRNPNFKVAGSKEEASVPKDDRNANPEPPKDPPTIANMVYPSQPPGVGEKTSAIPRPEGSLEAAIEGAHGDIKLAAKNAQQTAESTKRQADTLAKAQAAADKKGPSKR